jgi:uncharacterized protein (TIGR01319 family)
VTSIMGLTLAIDFGSTYTKLVAFDLTREEIVAVTQTKSTVDTDITLGLRSALEKMYAILDKEGINIDKIFACSSAAGGLRMVAIGLVKALTTKAAEEAALGAGAKLVGTYSYGLNADDIKEIEHRSPDLILLTGGTDGGNKEVIIDNAKILAKSRLNIPIIIAGNRMVAQLVKSILSEAGKYAVTEENVLPELDRLKVEPTRDRIRDIFMHRITHAKGLDRAKSIVGDIIMPTPMAVLNAATLLADGTNEEEGLGELIVVDIGGATTDIHSVAHGYPTNSSVVFKGLPEPYRKRTVEGDLGIRYNAKTILEKVGKEKLMKRMALLNDTLPSNIELEKRVEYLSNHIDAIPQIEEDSLIDLALASVALDIAMQRHVGTIKETYLPCGTTRIQYGKDLTNIRLIIGTGGIFSYGDKPYFILKWACYNKSNPESLRPIAPELLVDERYILFAIGLLADISKTGALRIMKRYLKKCNSGLML